MSDHQEQEPVWRPVRDVGMMTGGVDPVVAVASVAAVTAICFTGCFTAIIIFRTALADVPVNRRVEIIDALTNFVRAVRNG